MKTNPLHTYMLYARVSPKGSDWNAEETSAAQVADEFHMERLDDYFKRVRTHFNRS